MKAGIRLSVLAPRWVWTLLIVGLMANVTAWLTLGALPDEAYYWVWSQRLQAGYFDHPPLIAWIIRPFTELFGNSAVALRLPGVMAWFFGLALAWDLARRLYGSEAGWLAVLVWASLPIVQVGFHIATPDTPLVLFTWVTFYFALRALEEQRPLFWAWAGMAAGLAMLGKYPGLLVPVAVLGGLGFSREGRRILASPGPWIGAALAAVVVAPMVVWNARNDWVSFAFQLGHGVQAEAAGADPLLLAAAFLAGQLLVTMPWTWLAMAVAAVPWRVSPQARPAFWILATGFWLPLLVFGLAGLTAKSHPNWPVAAYVPGTLLLAGWLVKFASRRWFKAAAIVLAVASFLLVNLIRFPHWITALGVSLPPQRTQLAQAYGWDEVGAALHEFAPGECSVLGDRLQTTAMVALLLGNVDRVMVSNETRLNQFHLWQRQGTNPFPCVYVAQGEERRELPSTRFIEGMGHWRIVRLLEHHNLDGSVRWTAIYLPESAQR